MISKNEYNKKVLLKYTGYTALIVLLVLSSTFFLLRTDLINFFQSIENRTFDIRQEHVSKHKKVNPNIVIVTVDNESYEYLVDKYGEWPIPRYVYSNIVDYIEKQKPAAVAFDLMFVKSLKSSNQSDTKLVNLFKKYNNVYTAINFDSQDAQIRRPVSLPDRLSVNIDNKSKIKIKNPENTFSNCRTILPQIMASTANIGHINLMRDEDGISRRLSPFMVYQDKFYPHLALKVASDYTFDKTSANTKKFKIDSNSNLVIGNNHIPLDYNGSAILNWYGPSGSFPYIPFWKLEKLSKNQKISNDNGLSKDYFKGKIVYFGVSSTSMFDIKPAPTDKIMPGVELHTTFINNFIDNDFIKRAPLEIDFFIALALSLLVGYIVLKLNSTVLATLSTLAISITYLFITTLSMQYFDLWISIVLPITMILITFIVVYLVKYFLKSRDFEYTYKLATTDGLTELYNHRYFQEQMLLNIETCKRYNTNFALILIDIDHFKRFNDTFGHQSGDAVLKQVAATLKKNVRSTDIVCRYGGEEMSIILTNTGNEEALFTAQKICDAVASKPYKLANDQESTVTISLGVSTYPIDGQNAQELIETADKRLYCAKENGRNQVGKDNK